MVYLKYLFFLVTGISGLIILIKYFLSKKPFKLIFLNALISILSIIIINLTSNYTGAYIPINEYTASVSAVFGLPAIFGFLILRIIFI